MKSSTGQTRGKIIFAGNSCILFCPRSQVYTFVERPEGNCIARLKLEIPEDRYHQLMEIATAERWPLPWQAEVLLMRAIADRLTAEEVPTLSGRGEWQKGTIGNLLA
jgi:hypothetical protein